jgi:hypothetical protein
MNIIRNNSYRNFILSLVLVFNLIPNLSAIEKSGEITYREQVYLYPGRDSYITGEGIWFEAFCLNKTAPANAVLSKVLYVELISDRNEHVLGQILNLKENRVESNIVIPDTLQTGLYYLKAYTQWMENFGPESFYSKPIFIYNQFDEKPSDQLTLLKLPYGPYIFIEGSHLINGIKSKIEVTFPNLRGKEASLNVVDVDAHTFITRFITDINGEGRFEFVPVEGHNYKCQNADSASGLFAFNLPKASNSGYMIEIISVSEKNVTLKIEKHNVENQKLELYINSGNTLTGPKSVKQEELEKELIVPFVLENNLKTEILLKDTYGKILAKNEFIFSPENPLNFQSLQNIYNTREKIDFKVLTAKKSNLDSIYASISVHKTKPSFQFQRDNTIRDRKSTRLNSSHYATCR